MPLGFFAVTSAAVMVCGTISLYTFASRTLRAINCAYCAPKSTTRTGRAAVLSLIRCLHTAHRDTVHCASCGRCGCGGSRLQCGEFAASAFRDEMLGDEGEKRHH